MYGVKNRGVNARGGAGRGEGRGARFCDESAFALKPRAPPSDRPQVVLPVPGGETTRLSDVAEYVKDDDNRDDVKVGDNSSEEEEVTGHGVEVLAVFNAPHTENKLKHHRRNRQQLKHRHVLYDAVL